MFECSPLEVNMHRNINVDHPLQSSETQQALNDLYEAYRDIFPLHQSDIGQTKFLIGKFEFKKVHIALAQATTHLQQLINEVLKCLSLAFGYLDNI